MYFPERQDFVCKFCEECVNSQEDLDEHLCNYEKDLFVSAWKYPVLPVLPKHESKTAVCSHWSLGTWLSHPVEKPDSYNVSRKKFRSEAKSNNNLVHTVKNPVIEQFSEGDNQKRRITDIDYRYLPSSSKYQPKKVSSSLRNELEVKSPARKTFFCNSCGEHFKLRRTLKRHHCNYEKDLSPSLFSSKHESKSNAPTYTDKQLDSCSKEFCSKTESNNSLVRTVKNPAASEIEQVTKEDNTVNRKIGTKTRRRHKCNFCQRIFLFKCALDRHRSVHTGEQPRARNVRQKRSALLHRYLKNRLGRAKKRSVGKSNLKSHHSDHAREGSVDRSNLANHRSDYAREGSVDRSNLANHRSDHARERSVDRSNFANHRSDRSKKRSVGRSNLKSHRSDHAREGSVDRSNFVSHLSDHARERSLDRSNLICHRLDNARENLHTYEVRQKRFGLKSYFKNHCLDNTRELSYCRESSDRRFVDKSNLSKQRSVHTIGNTRSCDFSEEEFRREGELPKPLIHSGRKLHSRDIYAKQVYRNLTKRYRLLNDIKSYKCGVCKKLLFRRDNLSGQRRPVCDSCQIKCPPKRTPDKHFQTSRRTNKTDSVFIGKLTKRTRHNNEGFARNSRDRSSNPNSHRTTEKNDESVYTNTVTNKRQKNRKTKHNVCSEKEAAVVSSSSTSLETSHNKCPQSTTATKLTYGKKPTRKMRDIRIANDRFDEEDSDVLVEVVDEIVMDSDDNLLWEDAGYELKASSEEESNY